MAKYEQKLYFYEQSYEFNETTRQNELIEKILLSEWCDIRDQSAQQTVSGIQTNELGITHTAHIIYLNDVEKDMWCYRLIRNLDRSITKQTFKVVNFQRYQQDNRYMLLQLSEVVSNGN